MDKCVAVVGQGYVGLPLALSAADAGFHVFGIDTDTEKMLALEAGNSPVEDVASAEIRRLRSSGKYQVRSDYSAIKEASIILIAVPTPLHPDRTPNLDHVKSAVSEIARFLQPGSLVLIESTTYPGATRTIIAPLLAELSGIDSGGFDIAYSPERIDPTNKTWTLRNTPKLVAGLTEESTNRATDFYRSFIEDVIPVATPEIAETAKLLENTFRFVNISLINEMAEFCDRAGIPILDVIDAAATKPFGYLRFNPSAGVGGHCIPIAPHFLNYAASQVGSDSHFIKVADEINRALPAQIVKRAEKMLGGSIAGKRVVVIGVAYKPNVADTRETPAAPIISALRERHAEVSWHDEHAKSWLGEESVPLDETYDLAILVTRHSDLDMASLGTTPIVDTTWHQ